MNGKVLVPLAPLRERFCAWTVHKIPGILVLSDTFRHSLTMKSKRSRRSFATVLGLIRDRNHEHAGSSVGILDHPI